MSYVSQSNSSRTAGIAGVVAIHAGLGALVILGLSTSVTQILEDKRVTTFAIPEKKDPPPPPPEKVKQPQPQESVIYVPPVPNPLPKPNFVDTTVELPPLSDDTLLKVLPKVEVPTPTPQPSFLPARAVPRNNPGAWVTDSDYKSRWIREGLYGKASFKLDIGADGKVESCSITRSTGHPDLDAATCELVTRRAKFKPATDGSGAASRGTYSNSVSWQIPN